MSAVGEVSIVALGPILLGMPLVGACTFGCEFISE